MSWKFTRTVGVCAVIKADRESDVVHSFRNSTVPYIQSKIIKNTLAMSKFDSHLSSECSFSALLFSYSDNVPEIES